MPQINEGNFTERSQLVMSKISPHTDLVLTLEESLSIPTMVSMTHCPKQLIKWLLHLPSSHVVTCPTRLSFFQSFKWLNDELYWRPHNILIFCPLYIIHSIHSCMTWIEDDDLVVSKSFFCCHFTTMSTLWLRIRIFYGVAFLHIEWRGK